jgi:hypothetical protein
MITTVNTPTLEGSGPARQPAQLPRHPHCPHQAHSIPRLWTPMGTDLSGICPQAVYKPWKTPHTLVKHIPRSSTRCAEYPLIGCPTQAAHISIAAIMSANRHTGGPT